MLAMADTSTVSFQGKDFALLLVGGAYRSATPIKSLGFAPCISSSNAAQEEVVAGYRQNVLEPLVLAGARTEVLLTFPRCTDEAAQLLGQYLDLWPRAAVGAHRVVESNSHSHGVRLGYELLKERRAERARLGMPPYDYVLQGRNDVLVDRGIFTWPLVGFMVPPVVDRGRGAGLFDSPLGSQARGRTGGSSSSTTGTGAGSAARVTFDRLLFEQESIKCDGDTGCNFHGLLSQRLAAIATRNPRPVSELCSLCTRDHLVWMPARFVDLVAKYVAVGSAGHFLLPRLLREGGLSADDAGFLFPADCHPPAARANSSRGDAGATPISDVFTLSMCNEAFVYRPLRTELPRAGDDPAIPVPTPENDRRVWLEFVGLAPKIPPRPPKDKLAVDG